MSGVSCPRRRRFGERGRRASAVTPTALPRRLHSTNSPTRSGHFASRLIELSRRPAGQSLGPPPTSRGMDRSELEVSGVVAPHSALRSGAPPRRPRSTTAQHALRRPADYRGRSMTITVPAGIAKASLAGSLAGRMRTWTLQDSGISVRLVHVDRTPVASRSCLSRAALVHDHP